jgi:hypothetical protein
MIDDRQGVLQIISIYEFKACFITCVVAVKLSCASFIVIFHHVKIAIQMPIFINKC